MSGKNKYEGASPVQTLEISEKAQERLHAVAYVHIP